MIRKKVRNRYFEEKVFNMDIQTEKIRLIEWLAGLNDTKTLREKEEA